MAFEDIGPGPLDDDGVQQSIDPRFLPPDDPRRKFIHKWIRAGMPGAELNAKAREAGTAS